jgi:hypothetical protein
MGDWAEAVRVRAYELWEIAGKPDNRSDEFWLAAETEIRERSAAEDYRPVAPSNTVPIVSQSSEPEDPVATAA